jgi:hypothetical protein
MILFEFLFGSVGLWNSCDNDKRNRASEIIRPEETGIIISDPHDCVELAAGISRFLPREVRDSVREKISQSVRNLTIEENTLKL